MGLVDSLHFTPSHFNSLQFTPFHSNSLHFTPIHSNSFHFTPLHSFSLQFTPSHSDSLNSGEFYTLTQTQNQWKMQTLLSVSQSFNIIRPCMGQLEKSAPGCNSRSRPRNAPKWPPRGLLVSVFGLAPEMHRNGIPEASWWQFSAWPQKCSEMASQKPPGDHFLA